MKYASVDAPGDDVQFRRVDAIANERGRNVIVDRDDGVGPAKHIENR